MSNTYTFYHAFANAPFTAATAMALTDSNTLEQVTLAAGTFVDVIYFNTGTFSSSGNLTIGWLGQLEAVMPATTGISTDDLNNSCVSFNPTTKLKAPAADQGLVVTSDSDVTSGSLALIIKCVNYNDLP